MAAGKGEEGEDDSVSKEEDEAVTAEESEEADREVEGELCGGREAGGGPGEEYERGEGLDAAEERVYAAEWAVAAPGCDLLRRDGIHLI